MDTEQKSEQTIEQHTGGGLSVTFANVGYGEAVLIRKPDINCKDGVFTMLIDGGSGEAEEFAGSTTGRRTLISFLEEQKTGHIDILVNTHIHEDHTCGLLPVVKSIPVERFWQTLPEGYFSSMKPLDAKGADTPSGRKFLQSINDYREICRILSETGCEIFCRTASDNAEDIAENLKIRILAPSSDKAVFLKELMDDIQHAASDEELRTARNRADAAMNNLSLILMLEYAGRRILLPGDTNREGYGRIECDLHADIFKVGHHGQKDGVSRELFRRIRPAYVVCCASSDRRYESAAPEILKMMKEEGADLFFSDCPDVPPYTDGVAPHHTLTFSISPSGEIQALYG